MLADPEMDKVRALVRKLSNFYWSRRLPQHCVLDNGTGLGRLAYEDMAAFNIAWCYVRPSCSESHIKAVMLFNSKKEKLNAVFRGVKLRDAVMLLSKDAFELWLTKVRNEMTVETHNTLLTASRNRGTF